MREAKYTLKDLTNDSSFRAWAEGQASLEEKKFWDKWISECMANRDLALRAQRDLNGFSISPNVVASHTSNAWRRLNREIESKPKFQSVSNAGHVSGKWMYTAAAGILILITAGIAYLTVKPEIPGGNIKSIQKKVTTNFGERKKITFSDGSSVVLNANSILTYYSNLSVKGKFNVRLEGEAYFDVAERTQPEAAPFIVNTSDGRVSVLGTTFVVSTRNRQTRVVLEEGKIAIDQQGRIAGKRKETILYPGDMATFSHSSEKIQVNKVNTKVYTSWTTNILRFDRTPFAEIEKRLEHTFGVQVVVQDSELYQRKVSGSLENAGLQVIASALSEVLETSISISGDTVYVGD